MGLALGIDIGNGYTKIASLSDDATAIPASINASLTPHVIPSCMMYNNANKTKYTIGWEALKNSTRKNVKIYENIKSLLSCNKKKELIKPPAEILLDFISRLFDEVNINIHQVTAICISLTHDMMTDLENQTTRSVRDIFVNRLKIPTVIVTSEPIAAAAYYKYRHEKDVKTDKTVMIVDAGETATRISLCRITDKSISVISHQHVSETGGKPFWEQFATKRGADTKRDFPTIHDIYRCVCMEKETLEKHCILGMEDDALNNDQILKIGEIVLTYNQLMDAIKPIEKKYQKALNKITNNSIKHIMFTGGFSEFLPVRHAIQKHLGMWKKPVFFAERNRHLESNAIALGLAAIAAGKIQIEQPLSNTIGLIAYSMKLRQGNYQQHKHYFPLLNKNEQPAFLQNKRLTPHYMRSRNGKLCLHPYLEKSPDTITELKPQHINLPKKRKQTRHWQAGMKLDNQKNVWLILHECNDEKDIEYKIGKLADIEQGIAP